MALGDRCVAFFNRRPFWSSMPDEANDGTNRFHDELRDQEDAPAFAAVPGCTDNRTSGLLTAAASRAGPRACRCRAFNGRSARQTGHLEDMAAFRTLFQSAAERVRTPKLLTTFWASRVDGHRVSSYSVIDFPKFDKRPLRNGSLTLNCDFTAA
jgi:hypothetical protein